jgi:hypothetical protein
VSVEVANMLASMKAEDPTTVAPDELYTPFWPWVPCAAAGPGEAENQTATPVKTPRNIQLEADLTVLFMRFS